MVEEENRVLRINSLESNDMHCILLSRMSDFVRCTSIKVTMIAASVRVSGSIEEYLVMQ